MSVALQGPSAMALTAGILLLSRSRSFGQPLPVSVVGDPGGITPVLGPALVHAPVLASCGVGRELGSGALVIVPGPPSAPLAVSLEEHGTSGWFLIDRSGDGAHPASQAFVAFCRSRDSAARGLSRELRDALAALSCPAEPALIDLLCAAPSPPLVRLSLALRAGRAMTGGPRVSITRFLDAEVDWLPDPLDSPLTAQALAAARDDGSLDKLVDRAALRIRDRLSDWLEGVARADPDAQYQALLCGLVEVLGHVAALPPNTMLPPLPPASDAVSVGLGAALGASHGEADANQALTTMFRFLGGTFVDEARYPVTLDYPPPPDDRLERWAWFCGATRRAADTADALWRRIIDQEC